LNFPERSILVVVVLEQKNNSVMRNLEIHTPHVVVGFHPFGYANHGFDSYYERTLLMIPHPIRLTKTTTTNCFSTGGWMDG